MPPYARLRGADVLFPAASMFTDPSQAEPAAVVFNFGPDFQFPPPQFESLPAPYPLSELARPPLDALAAAPLQE